MGGVSFCISTFPRYGMAAFFPKLHFHMIFMTHEFMNSAQHECWRVVYRTGYSFALKSRPRSTLACITINLLTHISVAIFYVNCNLSLTLCPSLRNTNNVSANRACQLMCQYSLGLGVRGYTYISTFYKQEILYNHIEQYHATKTQFPTSETNLKYPAQLYRIVPQNEPHFLSPETNVLTFQLRFCHGS